MGNGVARQHVACCRQQNCCQFVARLLLNRKGYMLQRYRQHVAGNEQHVGFSRTFRSRLIGQHLSDASHDLATLTLGVTTLVADAGLGAPSVYQV